jgi:uncharacterized C2H2 Zn-finger protein
MKYKCAHCDMVIEGLRPYIEHLKVTHDIPFMLKLATRGFRRVK